MGHYGDLYERDREAGEKARQVYIAAQRIRFPAEPWRWGLTIEERLRVIERWMAMTWQEHPGLYWAAMEACHSVGIPWTDPRTGKTYPPPGKKPKRRKAKKVAKKRKRT